jgi:hypothetical protein
MDSLYVTLYPSSKSIVNCQLLEVHNNRWDVRLSASLQNVETLYATFWLNPAPVNCHVRVVGSAEDPVTGELRASFVAIDLDNDERRRITASLLGCGEDYAPLRNVS